MVNAALYPSLKAWLTRLGGVYAVTNAMMLHPGAEAVQFRGLFALINLVIPGESSRFVDFVCAEVRFLLLQNTLSSVILMMD